MAVKQLKKTNYVPVLDDEFSEEEVHMAVKQLKEDKLCSCTRQRVSWRRSSDGFKTNKRIQILFLY